MKTTPMDASSVFSPLPAHFRLQALVRLPIKITRDDAREKDIFFALELYQHLKVTS